MQRGLSRGCETGLCLLGGLSGHTNEISIRWICEKGRLEEGAVGTARYLEKPDDEVRHVGAKAGGHGPALAFSGGRQRQVEARRGAEREQLVHGAEGLVAHRQRERRAAYRTAQ